MNTEHPRRRGLQILAIGGAATVVILLAAAYFWRANFLAPRPPSEALTINFASTPYFGLALFYVAQDRHLFEEENLKVNFLPYESGRAALDAVLGGAADVASVADLPVMFAANAGSPVSIIAVFSRADEDLGLVVRRDHGITRVREIRGKHIGVTKGTSGHYALSGFLLSRQMALSDVVIKNLKPSDLIEQLKSGSLDGIVTWEPYLSKAQQALGDTGATFYAQDLYINQLTIAGLRPVIEQKKEAILRLMRALRKAESVYSADPQASYPSIASHTGYPLEFVQRHMPRYHIGLELGQSLIMAMEDETRWAHQNRLIDGEKVPNFMNHVSLEPMLAVKPSAVTMVH